MSSTAVYYCRRCNWPEPKCLCVEPVKPSKMVQVSEQEIATLQAKAKAYDEGQGAWAIYDTDGLFVVTDSVEPNTSFGIELKDGYTCRKVRVCKEVER